MTTETISAREAAGLIANGEAVLVDIGVAMGPVIASIHAKRDEFREQLERDGGLSEKPKLRTSTNAAA